MRMLLLLSFLALLASSVHGFNCNTTPLSAVCTLLQSIWTNNGGRAGRWAASCGWCHVFGLASGNCATCVPSGYCQSNQIRNCYRDPCGFDGTNVVNFNSNCASIDQCKILFQWTGITCVGSGANGQIQSLNLGFLGLNGALPNFSPLGTSVKNIFLQNNAMTGGIGSAFPTSLTGLNQINLQNNLFTGAIPGDLLGMPNLRVFNLFGNRFTSFPSTIPSAGTPGLRSIRFNDNRITSSLSQTAMNALINLEGFYGYNNQMVGVIPDMTAVLHPNLLFFEINNNQFVGPLPAYLNGLLTGPNVGLAFFDVADNPLDCLLPATITNWQNIVNLTNNRGFFCNPLSNVVVPSQVVGAGACIQATLTSVTPNSMPGTTTSVVVTVSGSGFNLCLSGWVIKASTVGSSTFTTQSAVTIVNSNTFTFTLTNQNVANAQSTMQFAMFSGNVRFSNLLQMGFYQVCDPACVKTANNFVSGCDQSTGQCQCELGYGPNNANPYCVDRLCNVPCNNGGTCNRLTGNCDCPQGWSGISCTVPTLGYLCPKNFDPTQAPQLVNTSCSGTANGVCSQTTGLCVCNSLNGAPYTGRDCSQRACQPSSAFPGCAGTSVCCNRGRCLTIADIQDPNFLLSGGTGSCLCNSNAFGTNCEFQSVPCTPNDCYGTGVCDRSSGICACNTGYGGPAPYTNCSQCLDTYQRYEGNCVPILGCPGQCFSFADHGECNSVTGRCQCAPDADGYPIWSGADCSRPACPNDCSFHGECIQCNNANGRVCDRPNICKCSEGWTGFDCSQQPESSTSDTALAAGLSVLFIVLAALLGLYALRRYKIEKFKKSQGQEMK